MYAHQLLGVDLSLSRELKEAIFSGNGLISLGFSRINFSYFWQEKDVDYVLQAIEFVCKFGWLFLPNYNFDAKLGIWVSRDENDQNKGVQLAENDYTPGFRQTVDGGCEKPFRLEKTDDLQSYLEKAKIHLVDTVAKYTRIESFEDCV